MRLSLSKFTQAKLVIFYMTLALIIFLARGKYHPDNWSDQVFFTEFISLFIVSILLVLLYKYLPRKKTILPWLCASTAALVIIFYAYSQRNGWYFNSYTLTDVIKGLPSMAAGHLHFFGLFEVAPPPGGISTRPALLDTQLIMLLAFGFGLLLERVPFSKSNRSPAHH